MSDVEVGAASEAPLEEGHPDWRPWSGGHASPLEALWQWIQLRVVAMEPPPAETVPEAQADAEPVSGYAAVDAAAMADPVMVVPIGNPGVGGPPPEPEHD